MIRQGSLIKNHKMNIAERILLFISRSNEFQNKEHKTTIDNALNILTRVYPNFDKLVNGKRVIDFGCGTGNQSIALVKKFSCYVVGVDSNQLTLKKAIENASRHKISSPQLSFVEGINEGMLNNFDIVISQNSFEHFSDPQNVLKEMSSLLNNSGIIFVTFGPPWLAPYGSHMNFFCKLPWMNVFFSEDTIMKVRSNFRTDGAMRYEDVESGLNKMTIKKFESLVIASNLKLTYKRYECVKGMNWLADLPFLREFFINHVTAILSKN